MAPLRCCAHVGKQPLCTCLSSAADCPKHAPARARQQARLEGQAVATAVELPRDPKP